MTWKIRHEGSPRVIDNLTFEQVLEGLADGHWEATDEVQGPGESEWLPLEAHPALEEVCLEIEPPPPHQHEDETNLDMNPLIDVCLVLLVFFILTTSYAALQKRLEAPSASSDKEKDKVAVVTKKQIEEQMVHVIARMEGGQPVILVEKEAVSPAALQAKLKNYARGTKTDLLLEHDDNVPHDLVVQVIDAAKGAGVSRIRLLVP
jgi:biopolymer transport protein ExbD